LLDVNDLRRALGEARLVKRLVLKKWLAVRNFLRTEASIDSPLKTILEYRDWAEERRTLR